MSLTSNLSKLVRPLYMECGDLFHHTATVTKVGQGEFKKRPIKWIQLSETIFHPQGGGQPSDQGTINGIKVVHVYKERSDRIDQFEISHYLDVDAAAELPFKEGDQVQLEVDAKWRSRCRVAHTGGHLLYHVVGKHFPELILEVPPGDHVPTASYVKFKNTNKGTYKAEEMQKIVEADYQTWIEKAMPVEVVKLEDGSRAIQIGNETPLGCGGTHAKNLSELGVVKIPAVRINAKENTITVKYELSGAQDK